jgi:hypothetical protein
VASDDRHQRLRGRLSGLFPSSVLARWQQPSALAPVRGAVNVSKSDHFDPTFPTERTKKKTWSTTTTKKKKKKKTSLAALKIMF